MAKPKINVIDLDKTLVPFDTFRELVIREIKNGNIHLFYTALLRRLRFISAEKFKMKSQKILNSKYNSEFYEAYAHEIFQEINPEVMEKVIDNTDETTTNILLSASPDEYIRHLVKMLNWKGKGSFLNSSGEYFHLYENQKIMWLNKNYPKKEYEYYFAISDSQSDSEMMAFFEKKNYWNS